ncbi:MAG: 6,7-dimethyl-8-ribityllumazine synthase [Armatimonadetes bacterium CG07_land_8_20_14_0_80_40_9]|nr:MAG: 6,7-dimethyl-8-ribityllumazine synthase [Armatimonadetes bacterium CG07_land_8_20_14_0_80_40_9]
MAKIYEGKVSAEGLKFALVVSRFNHFISDKLLEGALDSLRRHGVKEENLKIVWVPGAWEIPLMAKILAEKGGFNAVICLGAVIRGATPHFDYIANEVCKGIAQVALISQVPVVLGILTCDTIEQAIERAGTKEGNKGWDAAISAMEMANLMREVGRQF